MTTDRHRRSTTGSMRHERARTGFRPAAFFVLLGALSLGGAGWLSLIHAAARHVVAMPPLDVLGAAILAAPVLAIALWLASALGGRLSLVADRSGFGLLVLGTAVVAVASVAQGGAAAIGHIAFGVRLVVHGAPESALAAAASDALVSVVANAVVVAIVFIAFRGAIWSTEAGHRGRSSMSGSILARRAFGLLASVAIAISTTPLVPVLGATVQAAGGGGPCPATAPVKGFAVSAIDVKMWLNRFGDNDPAAQMFVLDSMIDAVRAQEAAGPSALSIGLRDDPIQPLAIRANEGDCVVIEFHNRTTRPAPRATDNTYGMHIDGLAFEMSSSGDAIGNNAPSAVATGATTTYTYYVPNDPTLEGAHYIHPGPANRQAVVHGLFGTLNVEPPGSTYLNPTTGKPQVSGWEAVIVPGTGASFRENVEVFHEIGNEGETDSVPADLNGVPLPTRDPFNGAYRPGSRAIDYRSEPFMDRLQASPDSESNVYGSYTFGDTTNIMPRGYLADPTKIRLVHGGSEIFHVFHLHGGADRWRFNAKADSTFDYAQTGLDKWPAEIQSGSARLDSQLIGPGESYDLEIENGAGGAQQGAGEFLFHCHIAHHYFAGMWGIWRVFDTLQPDVMPLPDRHPLHQAVNSSALVGKTIAGQTITSANLDAWIRPQLPVQGVTHSINAASRDTADQDASVWDWTRDPATGLYLGEPDRAKVMASGPLAGQPWVNFANAVPGHPAALIVDQTVTSSYLIGGQPVTFAAGGYVGTRPKLLFNPDNGRPAFPLLRPHIGKRPPFSPNGHSGAPYLGETGGAPVNAALPIDPWANRSDAICPTGSPTRRYNVVGINVPVTVSDPTRLTRAVDPLGALDVLAEDKAAVYAGTKVYAGVQQSEPLAIRANIGDCVAVTYTSELKDGGTELPYSKTNIHIHHLQFDTQGSDGVVTGFSYEQSIRPYQLVDPQLSAAAQAGTSVLSMTSVAKFQPGVWIAVGMGTNAIEVHQIASIDASLNQLRLTAPLASDHAASQWAGTEFVQYRWYPDVELDNIFFHDHVNGIHGWSHGMVGQLIVEPSKSRYYDPVTGDEIRAGATADIHTDPACAPGTDARGEPYGTRNQCALIPGIVKASYREFALWTINDHEGVVGADPALNLASPEATLNLRAEPPGDRSCGDVSRRFATSCGGDPFTPILKAYAGDQVVIRNLNIGQGTNTFTIDGHRTFWEPRYRDTGGSEGSPVDTIHNGISEKFTLILDGGAGGPRHVAGDYLYHDGENRRFQGGAWGILRVLPSIVPALKPLPGGESPPAQEAICPAGLTPHTFAISAVDVPSTASGGGKEGRRAAFVPTSLAAAVIAKHAFPEPLVLHVAAHECVEVTLKNERVGVRVSFHLGALLHDLDSAGVNVGGNPGDQTVAPGDTRTYRFYADTARLESAIFSDLATPNGAADGLYGAMVVAPAGAVFSDPTNSRQVDIGSQVDVHVPGAADYRDFTTILADRDPRIGQDTMPYPTAVSGPALINYRQASPRPDNASMFSSLTYGDPGTPLLRAFAGDPVKVHVVNAPGSEQFHVFTLGGMSWPGDMYVHGSSQWQSRAVGPGEKTDIAIVGGAGGARQQPGDYFYGDLRRPFTQAGMWGLFRVLPDNCTSGGTAGLECLDGSLAPKAPSAPDLDDASDTGASHTDDLTNDATPTFSGTATSGTSVAVLVDGVVRGSGPVTAGHWSVSTQHLPDGPHWITATASVDGIQGPASSSLQVVIDTVGPTAKIDTAPPSPSADAIATFAFSSIEPDATFDCSLTTGADAFERCTSPLTSAPLTEGAYTFRVRATDAAGNPGTAESYALVIATPGVVDPPPAPDVPTLEPASDTGISATDGITADATPAFTGTGPDGATVQVVVDGLVAGTSPVTAGAWRIVTSTLTDGPHSVTARATNAGGDSPESAAVAITVDTVAPAAPSLTAVILRRATAGMTTVPVDVTWTARAASGPISRYTLQRATGPTGTFATQVLATPTSTHLTQSLVGGTQYRYRIRATDVAGNVGRYSAPQVRTITLIDGASPAVVYGGTWTTQTLATAIAGSVRVATVAGSHASLAFTGTDIGWVAMAGPDRGKAEIRIDGLLVRTVDLYAVTTGARRLVFSATGLTAGPHTIDVRVTGSRNARSTGSRVDVDAFYLMN